MNRLLTLLTLGLLLLLAAPADAQTKAPKKKGKRAKSGARARMGRPIPVPDALLDPMVREFESAGEVFIDGSADRPGITTPDYSLHVWRDSLLELSYRLNGGDDGESITGTIRFKRPGPSLAIVIFAFKGHGARPLGMLYLPVAPPSASGGMADFCRIIESSIRGALSVDVAGYIAAEPKPIATVGELVAKAGLLDVATACRRGSERTVYVAETGGRAIYAVPVDIWHDRTSPFWDVVITVFDCE